MTTLWKKKQTQRKILKTYDGSAKEIYPSSKVVSRDRSGTANLILCYTFEGSKVAVVKHDKPDDGVADESFTITFNDQGDRELIIFNGSVFLKRAYAYEFDANGNLEKSVMTNLINGSVLTTHYTWEQMVIPVQ